MNKYTLLKSTTYTMLNFTHYIVESFDTSDSVEHKAHYHDQVHAIMKSSYAHPELGGYGGHKSGSPEEHKAISDDINHPNHILKVKKVNGTVTSAAIYKKQHGRKLIAIGSNGSTEGKRATHDIIKSDVKQKRAWGELSGAAEHLYKKHGAPSVSNDKAEHLTGKSILQKNADNSYVRKIGGENHTKTIYGHPHI